MTTDEAKNNTVQDELQELESEIRRIIDGNKKFLERVLDDDFEPEDEPDGDDPLLEEL